MSHLNNKLKVEVSLIEIKKLLSEIGYVALKLEEIKVFTVGRSEAQLEVELYNRIRTAGFINTTNGQESTVTIVKPRALRKAMLEDSFEKAFSAYDRSWRDKYIREGQH